tara:strand:- start:992 stop:1207 length:216 start_codon:yes stop_codon:yes gene_type:complete
MKIAYKTRQGTVNSKIMTPEDALLRLAELESLEADTMRYAPTNSGNVRYNYNQEYNAINKGLRLIEMDGEG